MAHPLLISLANLDIDFRAKASNHAFILLALLPVPKFQAKKTLRGALESRLIHACLDFVLEPLKIAARIGVMMSDPLGGLRYCFTPLAGYIMDFQEAVAMACVCGKTSPVTMAWYKQFGDGIRHEPRTGSITLSQIVAIRQKAHPKEDLANYVAEAKKLFRLNGVDQPFWRDWPLAEPHIFLTPEPLHHWHKMFWDHDAKWCIRVMGGAEIDFRFAIQHPYVGFRHFHEGISKLKQVTGREHRDVQRYLVSAIAGRAPKEFVIAIRALMDFRYLAQAPVIDEEICCKIEAALALFHTYKWAIMEANARVGKGNKTIDDWYIPKLELMQSVVPNICYNGVPMQWSADITERAHITEIKDPAHSGNNQNYESQITRHLDRADKCDRFDLATSVRDTGIQFGPGAARRDGLDQDDEMDVDDRHVHTTSDLLDEINPVSNLSGPARSQADYFAEAAKLRCGKAPNAPMPFRTFAVQSTAFHLNHNPNITRKSVDTVAEIYKLDDLRPALADHIERIRQGHFHIHNMRGRRLSMPGCKLPFKDLHVWHRLRMQSKSFHDNTKVLPAQTVNVLPSSGGWEFGRFDIVLVNTNSDKVWPQSGIDGECNLLICTTQVLIYMKVIVLPKFG
jgi:hypothetical protein